MSGTERVVLPRGVVMLKTLSRFFPLHGLLFWGAETVLISSMLLLFLGVAAGNNPALSANAPMVWKTIIVALFCQTSLYYNDLYDRSRPVTMWELIVRMVRSLAIAAAVLFAVNMVFPRVDLGMAILGVSLLPLPLLLWRMIHARIVEARAFCRRILLIGSGSLTDDLKTAVNLRPEAGYTIASHLDPAALLEAINPKVPARRRASDSSLLDLAQRLRVDHVVVALADNRGTLPVDELLHCRFSGVKVEAGHSLYERMMGKIHVDALRPSWLIFSDGFRRHPLTALVKRTIDVVGAAVGLIVSAPLFVLIAVAVTLDSRGPVFYRQERVGEGGRRFTLIKFRSMCEDAEEATGPVWAKDNDERVTRVGQWLRMFRLDELPQMVNILRGEMSFVGPRPERPWFVDNLKLRIPYYGFRNTVKPGLTGWAQVRYQYGASIEETIEKLQYDLYYIKNMSLLLDAMILLETIKIMLAGRGAR